MTAALARRIGGALLVLLLIIVLHAGWRMASPAPWVKPAMLIVVALAVFDPKQALLVLAGLGPIMSVFGGAFKLPYSLRELLVVACLTGWALRIALLRYRTPLLPSDLFAPILCVVTMILASFAVELYGQAQLVNGDEFRTAVRQVIDNGALFDRNALRGMNAAYTYLEGIAVFAAAVALCNGQPAFAGRVAAMAAIGALGAAMLNIQRLMNAAVADAAPARRLRELLTTVRINVHYGDVNAAGSYFAMMFFPAAARLVQKDTVRALVWGLVSAAIFAASWMTGSRAAVAAIVGVSFLAILTSVRRRQGRSSRGAIIALAICVATGIVFVSFFPNSVLGTTTSRSVEIRSEMARISLGMLAHQPFFGVGVGGFFDASARGLQSSKIGIYYPRENAHNNFLQLLAEFGIVGFGAIVWLLYRAAVRMVQTLNASDQINTAGTIAGVVAFGLTALLGHPLLTPDVSQVFWLMLGLAACGAPTGAAASESSSSRARFAAVALVVIAVGLLPWRFRAETKSLDLEHVRHGVSSWMTDAEGTRYQISTEGATLFVASDARAIDIPLRVEPGTPPATVEIIFRDHLADRIVVTSGSWHVYRLLVVRLRNDPPYIPIQIRVVSQPASGLMIGRTRVR